MIFNMVGGGSSGGGGGSATASTSPQGGVIYTNGTSGLDAATLNIFARAISSNADISSATTTVYVDYGSEHRKVRIGDKVSILISEANTSYDFDIIGFNHDTLTHPAIYGEETATGKAGMTFQMHDLYLYKQSINSSNTAYGGWPVCGMRVSIMPWMISCLPADWQGFVKPVNKYTLGGSGDGITVDEGFLLSETEIIGYANKSNGTEGTQYAYYAAGNSKSKSLNGTANNWWERSPRTSTEYPWCYITTGGGANGGNATSPYGVAFAFCV